MTIDVLMPLRHGRFIRGDIVAGLLRQDVELRWLVDARPDLHLGAAGEALLAGVSVGPFWRNHMVYMARILAKRNRLLGQVRGEFVYHADADVILPDAPILPGMVAAMRSFPRLGATGIIYAVDWPQARYHLGTGSMLLRREDAEFVGPLRGAPCECSYVRIRLHELGKETVPLTRGHAHQWKRTDLDGGGPMHDQPEAACPLCAAVRNPGRDYTDVHWTLGAHGGDAESGDADALPIDRLRALVAEHGSAFRLFIDHADQHESAS